MRMLFYTHIYLFIRRLYRSEIRRHRIGLALCYVATLTSFHSGPYINKGLVGQIKIVFMPA